MNAVTITAITTTIRIITQALKGIKNVAEVINEDGILIIKKQKMSRYNVKIGKKKAQKVN